MPLKTYPYELKRNGSVIQAHRHLDGLINADLSVGELKGMRIRKVLTKVYRWQELPDCKEKREGNSLMTITIIYEEARDRR
jgi:hypothetical protein